MDDVHYEPARQAHAAKVAEKAEQAAAVREVYVQELESTLARTEATLARRTDMMHERGVPVSAPARQHGRGFIRNVDRLSVGAPTGMLFSAAAALAAHRASAKLTKPLQRERPVSSVSTCDRPCARNRIPRSRQEVCTETGPAGRILS